MEANHNIDVIWRDQSRIFQRIYRLERLYGGGMARYAERTSGIKKAFAPTDRYCRCIDDRIPGGGVRLAGAGSLLTPEEAAEILRSAGCDGIYSHEDCGAAANAKKDAAEPARLVAAQLNVPYLGHQHVEGPHKARIAYVVGTPQGFDWTKARRLPPGFTLSWRYTHPNIKDYAQRELMLSMDIAMGNHSFGERIDGDNPFIIVPVGDPRDRMFSVESITSQLRGVLEMPQYRDSVIIDGFTAP